MNLIVNQTSLFIRLLTNLHIKWRIFLGWFRTESNEDYNDVEFQYDETNDDTSLFIMMNRLKHLLQKVFQLKLPLPAMD